MNNYIQEYKNSLSSEFCQNVIELFENNPDKKPGRVVSGVYPDIKHTTDLSFNNNFIDDKWLKIEEHLHKELQTKLLVYIQHLETSSCYNYFKHISLLTDKGFICQRYIKNEGFYTFHQDGLYDRQYKSSRLLTFIWYLNDVSEGGETEFWGSYKVKPEEGKLVIFPSSWIFPHRGCMPISSNKYIVTGWLSIYYDNEEIEKIKSIDFKEQTDAFAAGLPSFITSYYITNEEENNNTESNAEKETTEKFRKSYGRVYYLH